MGSGFKPAAAQLGNGLRLLSLLQGSQVKEVVGAALGEVQGVWGRVSLSLFCNFLCYFFVCFFVGELYQVTPCVEGKGELQRAACGSIEVGEPDSI